MHLVQILLPLSDNDGHPFPRAYFEKVAVDMAKRFGGVTAYTRAPAEGRWTGKGSTRPEEVIVVEVMVDKLDETWWEKYRKALETKFRQDKIVIRAQIVKLL